MRKVYFLPAIPPLEFVAGTAVFMVQGGYGAGQRSLDGLLVWLQLPGILVVESWVVNSLLGLLGTHDYISVVLGHFMINTAFYYADNRHRTGVLVARKLETARLASHGDPLLVIEAGPAPENVTAELRRFLPDVVLLVDAADMGRAPGDVRWIALEAIDGLSASTHSMPLSMLSKFLAMDLGCDVLCLGIQIRSNEVGETVSREVLQAVDEVVDGLDELLHEIMTFEHPCLN